MGIQGLLPLLKSIQKPTHLRNFAGQTLGIDAYGWLHRGTVACAVELAQQRPTRKHIDFALNRVRMLIHFGVKPYLVFDGDYLPSKAHTEQDRASRRKESKRIGLDLLRMGKESQAHLELQKAVDVTPLMARELIDELKHLGVQYVVAPYEADSQLAYLEKKGIISGVLSEDSDLLVFGVQCLLTKLDQYGECIMVKRADFTSCREVSLVGWSDKEFRIMAMLSGCDYLPGIERMGLKTAYRLVRKHKTVDRVIRSVQFDGKMKVPAGYLEAFSKAECTFLHQWVFCPEAKCLVNLNSVPAGVDVQSMDYLGKPDGPEVAAGVASGDLDPNTKEQLVVPPRPSRPGFTRTRVVQTPDDKQGKSITEFFRPRRIPLAELDPNSFTPSPSQQRLLQAQQNTSWSASQVPVSRASTVQSLSTSQVPSSAPPARRVVSQGSAAAPLKKQRLCSETSLAASMGGDIGLDSSSRFFNKSVPQGSPSLRKTSAQRKKEDFNLWSDDSAAEAVAALTATPQHDTPSMPASTPRKRKKLSIYSDSADPDLKEDNTSNETSQESTTTIATTSTATQEECETPGTSFESSVSSDQNVFSKGLAADFSTLKSRFAFKSASPRSSILRTKSAPLPSKGSPLRNEQFDMSSLRAEEKDDISNVFHAENTIILNSSPPAQPTLGDDDNFIDDEEWFAMDRRRLSSKPDLNIKGSEDLLVPESPSQDESTPLKLDLGRFAFAG